MGGKHQAPATPELVERLRDPDFKGSFQHLRPWTEIDALFEEAADALEAQQARIAELEAESAALTKALTGLTCGGSEFFIRRGDRYVADIDACVSWVRRVKEDAHRRTIKAIAEQKASQALADRFEKALREILEPLAAMKQRADASGRQLSGLAHGIAYSVSHLQDIARQALSSQGRHEGESDERRILIGDCRERLRGLPSKSVHTCVTSPPYFGLRDYGVDGQIGLETTPDAFVAEMVDVFREVRRVLRDDGTLWLNLGDSYAGSWGAQGHRATDSDDVSWRGSQIKNHPKRANGTGSIRQSGLKPKDLIGAPWRVAFALQADGWYLRQDIIWAKPNPMPESVRDRCTKAHEYLFLLSKGPRYYFDGAAMQETANCPEGSGLTGPNKYGDPEILAGGNYRRGRNLHNIGARDTRNKRSVWTVATQPFKEAHFATYPPELIEPCILAGCPAGGTVLDPFGGAGTTGLVADRLQRDAILIELNPEYADIARKRLLGDGGMFSNVEAA